MGTSAGCEVSFRTLLTALQTGGDTICALVTDQANAFNSEDRDGMLVELYAHPQFQSLFRIACFGYGHGPSSLALSLPDGEIQRIASEEGSRQGCVIGLMLYCFGKKTPFEQAVANLPGTTARAYADDFTAVAEADDLAVVVQRLTASGIELNRTKTFLLWPHSTPVPQNVVALFEPLNIEIRTNTGCKALGGFLGLDLPQHRQQIKDFVMAKAHEHDQLFDALNSKFISNHITYYLLRFSAQPRLIYQARLTPLALAREAFTYFDLQIDHVLQNKLFARPDFRIWKEWEAEPEPLSVSVLEQTHLPCRLGGKAIRPICSLANAAHYASYMKNSHVTDAIEAEARAQNRLAVGAVCAATRHAESAHKALIDAGVLQSGDATYAVAAAAHAAAVQGPQPANVNANANANAGGALVVMGLKAPILPTEFANTTTFYGPVRDRLTFKLQKIITFQKENEQYRAIYDASSKQDRIRLDCLRRPGASAVLNPWPSSAHCPRKVCSDQAFSCWMNFTSGLAPFKNPLRNCQCGADLVANPTHAAGCRTMWAAKIQMHDAVKCKHTTLARRAGLPAGNEPPTNIRNGKRIRPDNHVIFSEGPVYADVTIRHPLCPSYVAHPLRWHKEGKLLGNAAKEKLRKFALPKMVKPLKGQLGPANQVPSFCARAGAGFYPLAMDTYGGLHSKTQEFLKRLTGEAVHNNLCGDSIRERNEYYMGLVSEIQVTLVKQVEWCFRLYARNAFKAHGRMAGRVRPAGAG